jgi:hypothetical protein
MKTAMRPLQKRRAKMKYDLKSIMTEAWSIFKNEACAFAKALKKAWDKAKNPITKWTQKEVANLLDKAARRASFVNATPASSKQAWYLAALMLNDINTHGIGATELNNLNLVLNEQGFVND